MRRRIAGLVAATTSAVVLAFVIPLCLLVRTVAEDRALANANEESRSATVLVSGLTGDPQLADLVEQVDSRSPARTSVLTTDGEVLGSPAPGMADDPEVQRALTGEAFTETTEDGVEILVPVITSDGTAVIRTVVDQETLRSGVWRAWLSIGLLGLGLMALAVVVAARLGRRVSTPVTDLAAVAERLQEGDLDARAVPSGPPETQELAETMNRLAERIEELLAAERAAVGDLSHRLRTPITALRLDAESLPEGDLAERLQEHTAQLQRTVDAIVRDARRPLRSSLGSHCDATRVVAERASFWGALAEDQGRPVRISLPPHPLEVPLDAADLSDAVDVLLDNVFAHTPDDVAFSVTLGEAGGQAVLEVADGGHGFAPAAEPKPGSTGLGLQIVRRTVAGMGGHLAVDTGPDGSVVRLSLPLR